jgi:hypothetical protein
MVARVRVAASCEDRRETRIEVDVAMGALVQFREFEEEWIRGDAK